MLEKHLQLCVTHRTCSVVSMTVNLILALRKTGMTCDCQVWRERREPLKGLMNTSALRGLA